MILLAQKSLKFQENKPTSNVPQATLVLNIQSAYHSYRRREESLTTRAFRIGRLLLILRERLPKRREFAPTLRKIIPQVSVRSCYYYIDLARAFGHEKELVGMSLSHARKIARQRLRGSVADSEPSVGELIVRWNKSVKRAGKAVSHMHTCFLKLSRAASKEDGLLSLLEKCRKETRWVGVRYQGIVASIERRVYAAKCRLGEMLRGASLVV